MKLTVLGNNSPFPGKGSACSGYLLRAGEVELLLDAGTGVSAKFLETSQVENLTGVIISHLHPDHCSDLIPLKYAIMYGELTGAIREKIPVWMPTTPEMDYTYLTGTLKNGYAIHRLDATTRLTLDPLSLSFHQTSHSFECYAMSISDGKSRLVYTGDTGPSEELIRFAEGADLLLCECSIMDGDELRNSHVHVHLTPTTAGNLAQAAGVKKLVLTHLWPYYASEALKEAAHQVFQHVEIAELGKTFEL